MRIGCTKLQCFLIHHFHKLIHASADMLCYSNRSIIPGIDQQTMKKFIQCYLISFLKANLWNRIPGSEPLPELSLCRPYSHS